RFDRYEILGPLGEGGMGTVYRARDTRLERLVALKVLRHDARDDRGRRFLREARALAALVHPNIVGIHDVGEHDGRAYRALGLVEGGTLRERLAAGPLALDAALAIARQVLDGLAAAHELGIAHRDLKPENLFLTRAGTTKLLDFGLAKRAAASDALTDTMT